MNIFSGINTHLALVFRSPKSWLFSFTYPDTAVAISEYDPHCKPVVEQIVSDLSLYGIAVQWIGSASLELPGQRNIDLMVPADKDQVPRFSSRLTNLYGAPQTESPGLAEWEFEKFGFLIEISLMDRDSATYNKLAKTHKMLVASKELREQYAELKRKSNMVSRRTYERMKIAFLDKIISSSSIRFQEEKLVRFNLREMPLESAPRLSLTRTFMVTVMALFYSKSRLAQFPKQLSDYQFVEELDFGKLHEYRFARYESQTGSKIFAKMWEGNFRNFHYYSLINEARVYQAFTELLAAYAPTLRSSIIKVPRFEGVFEEQGRLILLTEFVQSTELSKRSIEEQVEVFEKLRNFLDEVSPKFSTLSGIPHRSLPSVLAVFPFSLIVAAVRGRVSFKVIFSACTLVASNCKSLFEDSSKTFLHRSTENHNLIGTHNLWYLIDFQLSAIGHLMFDIAHTHTFVAKVPGLLEAYSASPTLTRIRQDKKQLAIFRVLATTYAIHQIAIGKKEDQASFHDSLSNAKALTPLKHI